MAVRRGKGRRREPGIEADTCSRRLGSHRQARGLVGIGIEIDDSGISVDRQLGDIGDGVGESDDADDGRNAERTRQDRRVRGPRACLQRDPGQERPIELDRHRRRQVGGHDHRPPLQPRRRRAGHEPCDARRDVAHIRASGREDLVADRLEGRGHGLSRLHDGRGRIGTVGDQIRGRIVERRIRRHQRLRVKDLGLSRAAPLTKPGRE